MVRRYAFTMIELIFAIVVIAISVMSLPMMTQVTSKGIESSLVQEAIFAAATKLNEAVTYRWDENSIDPLQPDSLSKIISTDVGGCATAGQRAGFIAQLMHRRCLNDVTIRPSTTLGKDAGDLDDLDDTVETDVPLFSAAPSAEAYKKSYTSKIAVIYAAFGSITAASQNMKKITVTISDNVGVVTSLSTYSANIGEIDYFKRSFQ